MGDDTQKYIDGKFDGLRNDLKWAVGIIVSVLSTILLLYGLQIHKLNLEQQDQNFQLTILDGRTEDLIWKTGWLMESSELQREYIKALANDESTDEFFDELDRMNARIMVHGAPYPTMRSARK